MTGQVKEEILTRFGELGVQVEKGIVSFRPLLLGLGEFRTASGTFSFVDVNGVPRSIVIPAGGLAFTCCQVPIVYRVMDRGEIRVLDIGGATRTTPGDRLDAADSRAVLDRLGTIAQIEVSVPRGSLRV